MKASRCVVLILILALLCGMMITARAEVATLGVYFCGRRTAEDGSEKIVRLEGRFMIMQNGEEVGIIQAGKETLTLSDTSRVRIIPMPETIAPDWDLSTASCEVIPEAGATTTVPIVVNALEKDAEAPTAAPTPQPTKAAAATPDEAEDEIPETDPSMEGIAVREEITAAPTQPSGPVVTPTLPPFDASVLAPTPEPEWKVLPAGSGKVTVFAYHDQNKDGLAGGSEAAVAGVTVCLLTDTGDAVTSGVTNAAGQVQFAGLPEGTYRIKAILPEGWGFTKKGSGEAFAGMYDFSVDGEAVSDTFRVSDGGTAEPGIALGKYLHVSGTCWFETTLVDGLYDIGEAGLPGVQLELTGIKNGLHYETISDAEGNFYFDRVLPAAYKLTVHVPDGMMFTRVPSTNGRKTLFAQDGVSVASRQVDLNDNKSKERQYIGFTWSGYVTGMCFLDANYNGIYDEGEPPMPGVKITAIKQAKDEEAAVTYSGADGTYTLPGLRRNTYKMRAVLPDDGSDFTRTVSDPLGNHFAARPGRRENFWNDFDLASGETRVMNVGVIYPASVTGYVYMDSDFSGTRSDKEKIVSGFLVKLKDENGATVAMDKTSVKGKYELTEVPPGNYSLSVTALKDYAFTRLGEGNVILNRTNGEGYSETFALELKENKTGMDIGMIRPGTIRGSVFADRNDNGIRDDGENGLSGVTVRLLGEDGEAFSAEIGEDGHYLFDAVMPGTYSLEYTLPENAVFARITPGGNTISGEKTGISAPFAMNSGTEMEGPVCGALTLGRIEGSAWMDHNGDGIRSEDEESTAGLTVTLTPSRPELEEISVTTGEDGSFTLNDLRPDEYTLTVACPDSHVLSRADHVTLPLTAGKMTQSVKLNVPMGRTWTGEQLGVVIPAAVSGQLWMDENNNGVFDDDEYTPAGYLVVVTDDSNGEIFDTLTTDEDGYFATSGMIPGRFTLSFALDENTLAAQPGDSDFREENGQLVLSGIELAENEERSGLLLGVVRYTTIGGTAWIDRGSTVEALSGVSVTLTDRDGNKVRSLTTAENGAYKFEKLMPGLYRLAVVVPEGCVIIETDDRRLSAGLISVINEMVNREGTSELIDLKMGDDLLQMNIGCVLPGRIGDFCWLDLDGDGLQGMDEPGIPGVRIVLLKDGAAVAETVTDQYGFYRFSDLYPAVYTLSVTPPGQVKPTRRRTDIRMIASVLEETEDVTCESIEIQVESDKSNYNVDLGFVCRKEGTYPPGVGEGKKQNWTGVSGSDN